MSSTTRGSTFGDAEQGTLTLSLNDISFVTVDLSLASAGVGSPGAGTKSHLVGSSGFFELSQTGSAYQSNAAEFGLFKNRTGKFKINKANMRNGWNFARVTHTIGSNVKQTNYIEWVVDASGSAVEVHNPTLSDDSEINLGGNIWLSGIQYATGSDGKYRATIEHYYENVWSAETVTFGQTNCIIASQPIPTPSEALGYNEAVVAVTGSFVTNATELLGGTISTNISVDHVLKANVANSGSITSSRFLIFSASNNSTDLHESFNREDHRRISGSYDAQNQIVGGSLWNSTLHLSSSAAQTDGLAFYNNRLYTPSNTLNSGDFRSVNNGGSYFGDGYSYDGNPNYSGLTTGTKTFFRAFKNQTGNPARDFDISIVGAGSTIVPIGTSIADQADKIRVHAKIPGATGFLDLGTSFTYNTGTNGSGGRIGSLDATVDGGGAANHFSFGTGSVANNDYVVLKIEADADWTGYLEDITVVFPAVGVTAVTEAPDISDVNCSDTGADGKLSFGPSKPIGSYSNVGGAGVGSVDINGSYAVSSAGGNLRRGIFDGGTDINGIVNSATTANGNSYVTDSFGTALTGTLALEVNGVTIVSQDLQNVQLGQSFTTIVNGNGTGFTNVTAAAVGEDGSSLPDYRRWYRKANWNVDTLDQREGWNYARVVHSQSVGDNVVTNYVEWVNDDDSNTMAIDKCDLFLLFWG